MISCRTYSRRSALPQRYVGFGVPVNARQQDPTHRSGSAPDLHGCTQAVCPVGRGIRRPPQSMEAGRLRKLLLLALQRNTLPPRGTGHHSGRVLREALLPVLQGNLQPACALQRCLLGPSRLGLDGAFFGREIPSRFLSGYSGLVEEPKPAYRPAIFGFIIHPSRSLPPPLVMCSPYYQNATRKGAK